MAEKKLYEGMFLVDSARAASDWNGVNAAIKRILDRAEAEIVSMRKWDDRRLAYDIRGVSRGTYLLCYFRADGRQIQSIEKAVQLSETIMRVLILNADQMTQEDIDKDTPAMKAEKEKEKVFVEQSDETETDWQSDQEDVPEEEDEVPFTGESPNDDLAPATEDIEEPEETAKAEEPEDSQPKIVSDD